MIFTHVPKLTAVRFTGLNKLTLPFAATVLDGAGDLPKRFRWNDTDTYQVKSITGLEPPERTIAIAASASGGKYQGATWADREIVVLIKLNPDRSKKETPKLLRDNLYTMMQGGQDPKIDIALLSGTEAYAHEFGYVKLFEANLFDANPVVQITFAMLNPTFRSYDTKRYAPSELSEKAPNIYNNGTAETGFKFGVVFTGTMNGWSIKQADHRNVGMKFDKTFHAGDTLTVSTVPGERYIHWKPHRGKVKNVLSILEGDSEWLQLHPGSNRFVVPAKTGKWDWQGNLSFVPHYVGA